MTKITIVPSARAKRAMAELADNLIRIPINGSTADEQLAQRAQAIRALGKRTIANVIEIGHHLAEGDHGRWLPWLKREFGWSEKTAEQFMNVSQLGDNSKTFRIWTCRFLVFIGLPDRQHPKRCGKRYLSAYSAAKGFQSLKLRTPSLRQKLTRLSASVKQTPALR